MPEKNQGYDTGEDERGSRQWIMTINFLLTNADLLNISVFIFFDKTYLQKPHGITIENISSSKKI